MAIWELNHVLLAKKTSPNKLEQYENEYANFERLLMEKLPPNALRTKDEELQPNPKILLLLNPSLTFDDKVAMAESFRFLDQNDQLVTLHAINYAINSYVEERTRQIYQHLGGQVDEFRNILVAAGDGSSTTGILEEREKDEKGRWNKGLPKAVGLFPYQSSIVSKEVKKKRN